MPAYDVTYIDKKLKMQRTQRVYSRQFAAALRQARRRDEMVRTEYTPSGQVTTISDVNLRYRTVFRQALPGAPKPDETPRRWEPEA